MGRAIIRVRFVLPSPDGVRAVAISVIVHALLITFVLAYETRSSGVPAPLPVMTVSLVAKAPPAAAPQAIETTIGQKKEKPTEAKTPKSTPKPEPAADTAEAPKPKAKRRLVDEPTQIMTRPEGMSAQPEKPPVAEPPPPEPPSDESTSPGAETSASATPAETGVAGIQVVESAEPFQANWWFTSAHSRIERAWRNKPIIPRGSPSQRATVVFVVHKNGSITDVDLIEKSGYAPLDLSVHRTMSSIGKLPPLPPAYGGRTLTLRVTFELSAK